MMHLKVVRHLMQLSHLTNHTLTP